MPTDNPKISLYVPQQVYDRFKEFQQDQNLSMSQAGIVILAEYFGLEEIIKETTERTTVGGVTLAEFQELKDKVQNLEERWHNQQVNCKSGTSKPILEEKKNILQDTQLEIEMPSKHLTKGSTISINADLLSKRMGFKNKQSIQNKRSRIYKKETEQANLDFAEWTKQKDVDGIGWVSVKVGKRKSVYSPSEQLSEELLSKLQKWITKNTKPVNSFN